jgi:hypothetical protein
MWMELSSLATGTVDECVVGCVRERSEGQGVVMMKLKNPQPEFVAILFDCWHRFACQSGVWVKIFLGRIITFGPGQNMVTPPILVAPRSWSSSLLPRSEHTRLFLHLFRSGCVCV